MPEGICYHHLPNFLLYCSRRMVGIAMAAEQQDSVVIILVEIMSIVTCFQQRLTSILQKNFKTLKAQIHIGGFITNAMQRRTKVTHCGSSRTVCYLQCILAKARLCLSFAGSLLYRQLTVIIEI